MIAPQRISVNPAELTAALENPLKISNDESNVAVRAAIDQLLQDRPDEFTDDPARLAADPELLRPWIRLVLATNLLRAVKGGHKKEFRFSTLGQLAAIGRRAGVAKIFGLRFSGFLAWFLWRTIYLAKLPGLEKKLRVALDWTLDLIFSKDFVEYGTPAVRTVIQQAADAGDRRRELETARE